VIRRLFEIRHSTWFAEKRLLQVLGPVKGPGCQPFLALLAVLASFCSVGGTVARAQPQIDVRQILPPRVQYDEALAIEIHIANSGTTAADNVVVTDRLTALDQIIEASPSPKRVGEHLVWSLGSLAPGSRQMLKLRAKLAPHAVGTELSSAVTAVFQTSTSSVCTAIVERPDLSLAVKGPAEGAVGDAVSLQITLANRGTGAARDVKLQTLLPPGVSHPAGNDLENNLGSLAAGESRNLLLPVTLGQAGDVRTHIRLCGQGLTPVEREVRFHIQDLRIALSAGEPQTQLANSMTIYDLTVRNDGSEAIHQAHLMVGLPPGLAFVLASDRGRYDSTSRALIWDLGDLLPGEGRTVLWKAIAREVGNHEYKAVLTVGDRVCREIALRTQVVRAPDASPQPAARLEGAGQTTTADAFAAPPSGVECATWRAAVVPWNGPAPTSNSDPSNGPLLDPGGP
jgi:uncharacterized repeat protein (TIGR01451 family)